ncbi:hypothetical protein P5663_00920 [Priestia flexa]|uniref:hypothetical protein n=1 Tax=Priestia flexa TaxID=86664 RepID=UPI00240D5A2D|nr:hypothetical protein [Priestia flexa]WEZ08549.1 hypothetical protein P5663_00920 [Priestia flexa]
MEHMGWISLITAFIAVVLALISKNVILSLFMGALSGIVILQKKVHRLHLFKYSLVITYSFS